MTSSRWASPLRWVGVGVGVVGLLVGLALGGPVDAVSGVFVPFAAFLAVGNIVEEGLLLTLTSSLQPSTATLWRRSRP